VVIPSVSAALLAGSLLNFVEPWWSLESPYYISFRCGEMPNGALHAVAVAIRFDRINRVVVCRPRLEAVHAHAENRIRMARIQPDWGLRGLG